MEKRWTPLWWNWALLLTPDQPLLSPFSPGRPVAGEGVFWGRGQELRQIESFLGGERPPSLLVQGPRRIGKTSLLQHLPHLPSLRAHYRYAFVDLQSVTQSGAPDVLRMIASRLRRSLDGGRSLELPSPADFAAQPLETFLDFLPAFSQTRIATPTSASCSCWTSLVR